MTIQVGRFGLDITIPNPQQITRQGDAVMVSGWATGANRTELDVLIAQINNLKGPDEPVVPVVYSYDSTFNGYYRIESAGITEFTPDHERLFKFKYAIALTKISAYGVVECILSGAARAGKNAAMTGATFGETPWHATPQAWQGYDPGFTTLLTPDTRALYPGGTVLNLYSMKSSVASNFYKATALVGADPADYYTGAVKLQLGSTKYTAVGRQIVNDPTHWRLSNGLVQVDNSSGAGNHFTMTFAKSNGLTQGSAWPYVLGYGPAGVWGPIAVVTPRSLTVLRNTPEVVTIRLAYAASTTTSSSFTLDITLRRGARTASYVIRAAYSAQWGVQWVSTAATTDVFTWGNGFVETANNADGDRRFVATGTGVDGLGNGTVCLNSAGTYLEFAQGMVMNGAGTSPDRAVDLLYQYFAAVGEHDRIAAQ